MASNSDAKESDEMADASTASSGSRRQPQYALQVRELATNTDLNIAPANWLKGVHDTDSISLCLGMISNETAHCH